MPIEATAEMIAAVKAIDEDVDGITLSTIYRVMIAAAPEPPIDVARTEKPQCRR